MVGSADGEPTVHDRVVGVDPEDVPQTGIAAHWTVCNGCPPGERSYQCQALYRGFGVKTADRTMMSHS
jgi:hypothetical protein